MYLASSCLVAVGCTAWGLVSMPKPYNLMGEHLSLGRYVNYSHTPSSLNWPSHWGSCWLIRSCPSWYCCPKLQVSWSVLHLRDWAQLFAWALLIAIDEPLGCWFDPYGPILIEWRALLVLVVSALVQLCSHQSCCAVCCLRPVHTWYWYVGPDSPWISSSGRPLTCVRSLTHYFRGRCKDLSSMRCLRWRSCVCGLVCVRVRYYQVHHRVSLSYSL